MNAPSFLNSFGAAEWERLIPLLKERGLFDESRIGLIEAYCSAYGRFCAAEHALSGAGERQRERLTQDSGRAKRELRGFARDLGLTASVQIRNKTATSTATPTEPGALSDEDREALNRQFNEHFASLEPRGRAQ